MELEIDEDKLDHVLDVSQGTLSLHAWVGREEDTELMQLIEDSDNVAPNDCLDHKLLCDRLNFRFGTLERSGTRHHQTAVWTH